jgi:hypothetical protein
VHSPAFSRSGSLLILVSVIIISLSGQFARAQLTPEQQGDLSLWQATLQQDPGTDENRQIAAHRLIRSGWPESIEFARVLLSEQDRAEVALAICNAIAEETDPPPPLLDPLLIRMRRASDGPLREAIARALAAYPSNSVLTESFKLIDDPANPEAERVAIIVGLAYVREVETVERLIPLLDPASPARIREAARKTLEGMTGATTNGGSRDAWQTWWESRSDLGREGLLEGSLDFLHLEIARYRTRLEETERDRDLLTAELLQALEQRYRLTARDQRAPLLLGHLSHQRTAVRLLGLDLVQQDMSNAETIRDDVVAAVRALIADRDSTIRSIAISSSALLDGPATAGIVVTMLTSENDTVVRQRILTTLARFPVAGAAEILLNALERGVPAEQASIAKALVAGCRAGLVEQPVIEQAVALILKPVENPAEGQMPFEVAAESLPPDCIELLAWSENATVLDQVDRCLAIVNGAESIPIRRAAARGLSLSGRRDESLIAQAQNEQVYPFVIDMIEARQAGLRGIETILGTPAPSHALLAAGLGRIMRTVSLNNAVAADDLISRHAGVTFDPGKRAEWLSTILGTGNSGANGNAGSGNGNGNGNGNGGTGESGEPGTANGEARAKRTAFLRLAELRLSALAPDLALAALQNVPITSNGQDDFNRLMATSLIALGRIDQLPQDLAAIPGAWMRALQITLDRNPLNAELAQTITNKLQGDLNPKLTDEDREALGGLVERLTAALKTPESGVPGGEGDDAETGADGASEDADETGAGDGAESDSGGEDEESGEGGG